MKNKLFVMIAVIMMAVCTSKVAATGVTPTFTTFGSLPSATFGGSGIPNDSVAITHYTTPGGGNITLGLTAHQRYSNPPLGNDGAGTFYSLSGGDGANGQPNYGTWNFGFFAGNLNQRSDAGLYSIELLFDRNPAFGNSQAELSSFGTVLLGANIQDSWNLGMPFLSGAIPSPGIFNPNANGEYTFLEILRNSAGTEVARASINVVVGQNVPEGGSTLGMLTAALGFFGLIKLASHKSTSAA